MNRTYSNLPGVLRTAALCSLLFLLPSCTADDKNDVTTSANGSVALYITDASSVYQQVNMSLSKVELINSGTRQTCELLPSYLNIDVARLAHLMELVGVADCPSGAYNRIHIEAKQEMHLSDGTIYSSCRLAFIRDAAGTVEPLSCDPVTGICSIDLATAVRRPAMDVLPDQVNQLAIDFALDDFLVADFGNPATCTVTMKADALHLSEMIQRQDQESMSGRVARLDTVARTFTLRSGHRPYTVDYSGISNADQPGIDQLLTIAQQERFKISVRTDHVDIENLLLRATAITLKVEGTLSGLDALNKTFVVTFRPPANSLAIDYAAPAVVIGTLADQEKIEVIVSAYDVVNDRYQASIVTLDSEPDAGV